jgi:DNA-binding NarL/FixJ family response regulator
MDRSRVSSAVPDVVFSSDPAASVDADVVIVDLARHADAVAAVRERSPSARIIAFGPHVDDEALRRARTEGAAIVLARSQFFRDPAAAVRAAT